MATWRCLLLPLLLLATWLGPPPAAAGAAGPPPGYTLEQLHIVFRHGNRTPEFAYPNDPNEDYTWPPYGWNQLDSAGIASSYRLGQVIRQLYGDFLGDTYYQWDVNATSTDVPRAKLTLESVMAGMFPPKGDQQSPPMGPLGALWQPFVYNYVPQYMDDFLYMLAVECPRYNKEVAEVWRSDWTKRILGGDTEMVKVLREKGIISSGNPLAAVSRFYCTVSIETDQHRPVPDWVQPFYPDRLEAMAKWHFHGRVLTRSLQRLRVGPLVKHLVGTMRARRSGAQQPRVWLYSGHDDTVSALALAVRSWGALYPHFNAMVVLELLKNNSTGEYAVQVLLRESHFVPIHVVPVEGCGATPCPLDKFHELVKDVIPLDWKKECLAADEKKKSQLLKVAMVNGTIAGKNKL